MLRRDEFRRFAAHAGSAGMLATILAASAAEAALPTGGMLLPRPKGPSRNDLPASTSISVYRVPSATAYGLTGVNGSSVGEDSFAVDTTASRPKVSTVAQNRQPMIRPRMVASDDAVDAFADLTPAANHPLERNPFDATAEPSRITFADQRQPSDSESLDVESLSAFAGLKGICPVTLREERRVVTPRKEFSSEYAGRRYEFATADAKAAFDICPERYAPVLGGRDVVLTASGADEAVGSLKHAGFYRERLYLFQSNESCKSFYGNPRRFAVGE